MAHFPEGYWRHRIRYRGPVITLSDNVAVCLPAKIGLYQIPLMLRCSSRLVENRSTEHIYQIGVIGLSPVSRAFPALFYPLPLPEYCLMTKPRIVTCFPLTDAHVDQIRDAAGAGYEVLKSSQETIHEDIFSADIFCGHVKTKRPVDWSAIVAARKLKWIQSSAAGLDHCLAPPVIASDIVVSGCSALFARQVAETSMALLIALVRSMPVFFRAQQRKEYIRRPTDDMHQKKVGIIGFGGNGYRIAKTLRPMVGQVVATDLFPQSVQHAIEDGVVDAVYPADALEEMIGQTDVNIVTLPLSEANEKRIGEAQFSAMKRGAYFINVGRGSVVDQDALIRHLQNGRIAGAGLDVADPEPIEVQCPLWEMENVVITPHVGAQSAWRVPVTVEFFCENLRRYAQGQPPMNLVDKPLGFPRPQHRVELGGHW